MLDYLRDPAEITRRSFAIIEAEAKLDRLPPAMRPVAARIVHACGMPEVAASLAWSDGAAEIGRAALARGATILCDVRMVVAGLMLARLPGNAVHVGLDEAGADALAAKTGATRSAAGMELALARHPGAIVVIGNAPTALFRLLECVEAPPGRAALAGAAPPALVVGFPVGFVGAAESKAALAASGLPFITLHGRLGGSAIAAAAINALILGRNA